MKGRSRRAREVLARCDTGTSKDVIGMIPPKTKSLPVGDNGFVRAYGLFIGRARNIPGTANTAPGENEFSPLGAVQSSNHSLLFPAPGHVPRAFRYPCARSVARRLYLFKWEKKKKFFYKNEKMHSIKKHIIGLLERTSEI